MEVAKSKSMTDIELLPIAVCAVIAICAYRYGYRWQQTLGEFLRHRKFASKLNGRKAWPIVGNGLEFIGSRETITEKFDKMTMDYGPEPFSVWMGPSLYVVIMKPEDMQIILNSPEAQEKTWIYDFLADELGEGLITAKDNKWQKGRKMIHPLYNQKKTIEKYFPSFHEKNQALVDDLNKEVGKTLPFELWDFIADTNFDLMTLFVLGYNLKQEPNDMLTKIRIAVELCAQLIGKRFYKLWLYPYFFYKLYLRFTGWSNVIRKAVDFVDTMVAIKKQEFERKKTTIREYPCDVTNEEKKKSFSSLLETMLELNENGENFTDKYIRDEILTMLVAGSETVTTVSCFCLLMLAVHQNIQDKVYDEIYDVFGDDDEIITMEDIDRLVYLEQVVKETIRLFSPIPIITRQLQKDVQIYSGDHVLPKGTQCVMNLRGTHHIPELYPNPSTFNPENFSKENIGKRHKYSFVGFSGGSRSCIGFKYAMKYTQFQIAMFLRNFCVHTNIKLDEIKVDTDIALRNATGYPVTIRPRDRRPTFKRIST